MILTYPPKAKKYRGIIDTVKETSLEEAAIYDLIFSEVSLRDVAAIIKLSHEGVYRRSLAYMRYWAREGALTFNEDVKNQLEELYKK